MQDVHQNDKSFLMTIINFEERCMVSLKVFVFKFVVVFTMSDEFLSFVTYVNRTYFGIAVLNNHLKNRTNVAVNQSFFRTFKNRIQLIR